MKSSSTAPSSTSRCRIPLSSAKSVPGLICRNRSARSAVVVRRGSTTISFAPAFEPIDHAQEQDRMAVGHIGADDEEQLGVLEVVVGPRWPVGAEGLLVAGARAGHAEPRVRLQMRGADEALGQLRRQILRLQRHLADTYIATASGPCSSPIARSRAAASAIASSSGAATSFSSRTGSHHRAVQPSVHGAHQLRVRRTFRAQSAEVGRVQFVAGNPLGNHRRIGGRVDGRTHLDAATHPAVRALGSRNGLGGRDADACDAGWTLSSNV